MSYLIFSFLCIVSLLVPYVNVSTELIDCILSSSSALNAISLTSPVNTLCLSILNLCCYLNIIPLFLINS